MIFLVFWKDVAIVIGIGVLLVGLMTKNGMEWN